MKLNRRRRILVVLVGLVLIGWLTYRPILKHFLGFRPSSTGGTREGSSQEVRFTFDGATQPNGLPAPWQVRQIVGSYKGDIVARPSGERWIHLTCDHSHFVLWYEAVPFDSEKFPVVAWSWEAKQLPDRGDSRTHAELPMVGDNRNDKALQLMVGFEGDFVLNYVWDRNAPVGYECDEWSPVATVKTLVVDSGPALLGQVKEHSIDVRADFIRRFGKPPGKILGVGISANTNHTASVGEGIVGAIRALPPAGR